MLVLGGKGFGYRLSCVWLFLKIGVIFIGFLGKVFEGGGFIIVSFIEVGEGVVEGVYLGRVSRGYFLRFY